MSFLALQFQRIHHLLIQSLFCLIVIANFCVIVSAQPDVGRLTDASHALMTWKPQPGVTRYRLQIARDRSFSDILYDGLVTGSRYSTRTLFPGVYYWRVAPANFETGRFGKTARLDIRYRGAAIGASVGLTSRPGSSWQAITGEVQEAFANSGTSRGPDLLALNSQGNLFGIDSATGVASWTTRLSLSDTHRDAPVVLLLPIDNDAKVVIASDDGIRGLSATTGEKLWQVALTQHFVGGAVDAGSSDAYLLCDQPSELIIIDGNSGGLRKRVKLSRSATGPPVVLNRNGRRSLIIPLASALELRSSNGDLERTIQLESPPITPAVVVSHGNLQLVVVGTRRGLLTIDGTTFVPTRWISIGGDQHPLGVLSVANIDESEAPALVMISDRGRVITIDPFAGTVKWIADEGQSATGVAFADLDGDAVLDVIVPGDNNFARGLSGRDGTVIWQTEDRTNNLSSARRRQLITVNTRTGKRLLIGPDSNFIGLRAVELPEPTSATLP